MRVKCLNLPLQEIFHRHRHSNCVERVLFRQSLGALSHSKTANYSSSRLNHGFFLFHIQLGQIFKLACLFVALVIAPQFSNAFQTQGLELRGGAGSAFPILATVPTTTPLKVTEKRGHWVKLEGDRREGWIHLDQLHLVESIHNDQMWQLRNSARRSLHQLGLAWNTEGAIGLAYRPPHFSYKGREYNSYFQYQVNPRDVNGWSKLTFGINSVISNWQHVLIYTGGALGVGSNDSKADYWGDERHTPLGQFDIGLTVPLTYGLSISTSMENILTLDSELNNYTSLSVSLDMRL